METFKFVQMQQSTYHIKLCKSSSMYGYLVGGEREPPKNKTHDPVAQSMGGL